MAMGETVYDEREENEYEDDDNYSKSIKRKLTSNKDLNDIDNHYKSDDE